MTELPAGFRIEDGSDDYGPVFTLYRGKEWLDADFDRERLVAYAHHLAKPQVSRKLILEVLCHVEDRLIERGDENHPARKRARLVIDALFAAQGGRS